MLPLVSLLRRRRTEPPDQGLAPGSYLTDGRHLFRLVSVLTAARNVRLISLEDCRTLEIEVHTADEISRSGLRRVATRPTVEPGAHAAPSGSPSNRPVVPAAARG